MHYRTHPPIPLDQRKVRVQDIDLNLAYHDDLDMKWVGNDRVRDQLIASWLVVDAQDIPLNPRLIGKPGVGKTTLAYSVARELGADVYIYQCTMDTRPEDLLITPVIAGDGKIGYHASSLVTAMLRGQVCVLDEANRMSEKSWASLAPLLDRRRYVESIVTGLKIRAESGFRICCTMNDDASTFEVPEYIQSRLQPQIEVTFPNREEEREILRFNIPFSSEELLDLTTTFLQKAHEHDLKFTTRDGVNILRFCLKIGDHRNQDPKLFFDEAVQGVLGQEGADFMNGIVPSSAQSMRGYHDDLEGDDDEDDDELDENGDDFTR